GDLVAARGELIVHLEEDFLAHVVCLSRIGQEKPAKPQDARAVGAVELFVGHGVRRRSRTDHGFAEACESAAGALRTAPRWRAHGVSPDGGTEPVWLTTLRSWRSIAVTAVRCSGLRPPRTRSR